MSALKIRVCAIISLAVAGDYSTKKGYLVTHDGTTATISASATARANGVILDGGIDANGKATIGLLGGIEGTIPMKTSGIIAAGAFVQQAADGTILTDAGTGARVIVGQAVESAVSGDIIEVVPFLPQIAS